MNRRVIRFTDENYWFSNLSKHSVTFNGITYNNSEAAFQAQKSVKNMIK